MRLIANVRIQKVPQPRGFVRQVARRAGALLRKVPCCIVENELHAVDVFLVVRSVRLVEVALLRCGKSWNEESCQMLVALRTCTVEELHSIVPGRDLN